MGHTAQFDGPTVELAHDLEPEELAATLSQICAEEWPGLDDLLSDCANIAREKWDFALPEPLLRKAYASLNLDIDGARHWFAQFAVSGEAAAADDEPAGADIARAPG
jgi:ATP-dependent Lhr-like helicase